MRMREEELRAMKEDLILVEKKILRIEKIICSMSDALKPMVEEYKKKKDKEFLETMENMYG